MVIRLCCLIGFVLSHILTHSQNIIYVGGLGLPDTYGTIQEAVNAADPGDTIYVHPAGPSYGSATIDKKLTIIGAGFDIIDQEDSLGIKTISNNSLLGNITFTTGSDSSVMMGCETGYVIMTGDADHILFKRNKLTWMDINGPDSVRIISCFFTSRNSSTYEVLQVRNSTGLIITNNIFDHSGSGVEIQNTASALFQRNIVYGINPSNCTVIDNVIFIGNFNSPGCIVTNNIFTGNADWFQNDNLINVDNSTIFVGYPTQGSYSFDARYQLLPTSPAIGYAVDGGDCGVMAGTHAYKLSGIPNLPLIYELSAMDLTITENDSLSVNIKIRVEN